jgi:hypothetical protein
MNQIGTAAAWFSTFLEAQIRYPVEIKLTHYQMLSALDKYGAGSIG